MKLSLDALKLRAEAVASNDLLATISGGTNNDCHDTAETTTSPAAAQTKITFEIKPIIGTTPTIGSPITIKF